MYVEKERDRDRVRHVGEVVETQGCSDRGTPRNRETRPRKTRRERHRERQAETERHRDRRDSPTHRQTGR